MAKGWILKGGSTVSMETIMVQHACKSTLVQIVHICFNSIMCSYANKIIWSYIFKCPKKFKANFIFQGNVKGELGLTSKGKKIPSAICSNRPLLPCDQLVLLPHWKAEDFVVVLLSLNFAPTCPIIYAWTSP